ncbi:MAG: gamma-glutamylcyclotransferase, partial [Halofilum sp. (in: g-proteobacteria)]
MTRRFHASAGSGDESAGTAVGRLAGGITREALERDEIRQAMHSRHPEVALHKDADLHASMRATLADMPPEAKACEGVWLFGYGSLLWNPCVAVTERRVARLHGFHRDFRLQLDYGRGSPEAPGLMLGLVPGGSCRGVALCVPGSGARLEHELHLVWRREMLTGVYVPRWVSLTTDQGRVPAIAFIVNPQHECYRGRLDEDAVV